jgi:hypothetical protein
VQFGPVFIKMRGVDGGAEVVIITGTSQGVAYEFR